MSRAPRPPVVHRLPGYVTTDRWFEVPLDHTGTGAERIEVFAREVVAARREKDSLPWLLFLQGGPGYGAPRPSAGAPAWLGRATQDHRVLLLDQRGTGLSAPVSRQTLARLPDAAAQADYLTHFRADSIVADCELIRRQLIGEEPWSLLGQSYGGFCSLRYLSAAPAGLREVFLTGGVPPLERTADDVYRKTYATLEQKNRAFYARYPGDVERVRSIVRFLGENDVTLPSGDRLTVNRFRQLGMAFGMSDGFDTTHYLIEQAFVEGARGPELGYAFLRAFENALSFDTNPIFSLLHEAAYAQDQATNWSAHRIRAEFPRFDDPGDGPVLFLGEMILPWLFDEYAELRPLKQAAELLATKPDWPRLYDLDTLRANTVPTAAVVYHDDLYVARDLSLETAATVPHLRTWITSEYEHNGLRADGERILTRLFGMLHGEI